MTRVQLSLLAPGRSSYSTFFIELAKNDMRQWMINLPDQDLAYLPQGTEHFEDYVRAVHWAQDYALANRNLMMRNMIAAVQGSGEVPAFEANVEVVSCHHNYVTWEHHYGENVLITRKGAVRAREGDMGIIPGSMGARSYIVRGKLTHPAHRCPCLRFVVHLTMTNAKLGAEWIATPFS